MQTCLGFDPNGVVQQMPCPRNVQEWAQAQTTMQPADPYRKKLDFSDNAQTVFCTLIIAAALALVLVTLIKAMNSWAIRAEEKEAKQAEMDHEEVMKYGYDRTCPSCGRADESKL